MSSSERPPGLVDRLRPLRRSWLLIVCATLAGAGAALALALGEPKVYESSASLSFKLISQDLDLLGTPSGERETQGQVALTAVEELKRRDTAGRVQRRLDERRTAAELQQRVAPRVDPSSGLVLISAQAPTPEEAARIANAFAEQAVADRTRESRERFATAARILERRFRRLRADPTRPGSRPREATTATDPTTRSIYADRISRLESLAALTRPVQVVSPAEPNPSAIAPQPLRSAGIGGVLGLLLGLLGAFLRAAFDHRLRGSKEIRDELGIPLLGSVRNETLGLSTLPSNGGSDINDADRDGFLMVRQNLAYLDVDRVLRTTLVTSGLPEEGKSTVAASIAVANAASGIPTILLECDLRRPVLGKRLGLSESPGISDYLTGNAELDEVTQSVGVETAAPALSLATGAASSANGNHTAEAPLKCITAGTRVQRPAEMLGSERFRQLLAELATSYQAVIIDSAPLLSVPDALELVPEVDAVVLCVRVSRTTRDQAAAAKAAVEHFPARPTGIVVTGTRARDEGDYGYYSYRYTSAE